MEKKQEADMLSPAVKEHLAEVEKLHNLSKEQKQAIAIVLELGGHKKEDITIKLLLEISDSLEKKLIMIKGLTQANVTGKIELKDKHLYE